MSDTNLQVAAYGWLHTHWQTNFYPEDMPPEWCLSYYSNEFNVVMVPTGYWRKGEGFDCEAWLDDIHDDFRFYVECPPQVLSENADFAIFIQQLDFLRSHLAGVVLLEPDMTASKVERLEKIGQRAVLFSQTVTPGLDAKPIWQTGSLKSEPPVQLAVFKDDLTQLRQTRVQVEAFVEARGSSGSGDSGDNGSGKGEGNLQQDIIVKHEALSAADLMRFRSVIEIMGL